MKKNCTRRSWKTEIRNEQNAVLEAEYERDRKIGVAVACVGSFVSLSIVFHYLVFVNISDASVAAGLSLAAAAFPSFLILAISGIFRVYIQNRIRRNYV